MKLVRPSFGKAMLSLAMALGWTNAAAAKDQVAAQPAPRPSTQCQSGAYRAPDGKSVAIMKWEQGWVYLFLDGRYGLVSSTKSPIRCAGAAVAVMQPNGTLEAWPKVPLRMTRTQFLSGGTPLYGMLVEPADAGETTPLVIFVHGSGRGATADGTNHLSFNLPAQGISTFLFDKRGTGRSAGEFTMNFRVLANDVMAASDRAKLLARGRFGRFGLFGQSQGGWVAPLAAASSKADFIAVASGMPYSPLEEDAEEVLSELREKGYGDEVLEKARAVLAATHALMLSGFRSGFDQLESVKGRFSREPWFRQIEGEFTGDLLKQTAEELRREGREKYDSLGIEWGHEALPVLRSLAVPQLWIVAAEDREAVPRLTIQRLQILQNESKPIDIAVFPDTDHGILEFVQAEDGSRRSTRHAEGYYRLLADWIRGQLCPPYGSGRLDLSSR